MINLQDLLSTVKVLTLLSIILILLFITYAVYVLIRSSYTYARVVLIATNGVKLKDIPMFVVHCLRVAYHVDVEKSISGLFFRRFNNGSYWTNMNDWSYYNKRKGVWVAKKPKDKK